MKKAILLILAVLVIGGAVWADPTDPPRPTPGSGPSFPSLDPIRQLFINGLYTMPTLSAESRYSAKIFDSMVDNYIDVNNFDPNVGTFFFLGGYPSKSGNIASTNYLTGDNSSDPTKYAISFGLAKTLKNSYLGIYYSGSLVNTMGIHDESTKVDYSWFAWRNNAAVLLGTAAHGAFRLDIVMDTDSEKASVNNNIFTQGASPSPSLMLSWGGIKFHDADPHLSLAFSFPKDYIWGTSGGSYSKMNFTGKAGLALQAGLDYDLNETSAVSGDLFYGCQFGTNYSGDTSVLPTGVRAELPTTGTNINLDFGGQFAFGLQAAYKQTLNFGNFSVGFKPMLTAMFISDDSAHVTGSANVNAPSNNIITAFANVDLGIKYQANQKIAIYSGASLKVIDWLYFFQSGGTGSKARGYFINGIQWSNDQFTASSKGTNLGFGATITPVPNLVIGTGLNTLLDKFFSVNLKDMTFKSGSFFDNSSSNNLGDWATRLFRDLTFDLTVSYKF